MKKLKVLLACAGGMSTSLFCKKIIAEAEKNGYECTCEAFGISGMKPEIVKGSDLILLAPQVRFHLDEVREKFPDVPVELISMQDYGMVNGAGVFEQMLGKYSW